MENFEMKNKNQGYLRVWCLLLTDVVVLYGLLSAVLAVYQRFGGQYSLKPPLRRLKMPR